MIALFARPTSPLRLAAVAFAICSIIALYCLAYSALSGQSESIGQAFGWTLVNVVPWLLAVEVGKRGHRLAFVLAVLAAAFIGSLVLGLSLAGSGGDFAFEALRRVPGLAVTASLIGLLRFLNARQARSAEMSAGLPLPAEQIDWVSAAGNYIEIRGSGCILIHRASLSAAERELLKHGFVRIHRSTLVRRASIARIRSADVVLQDGTSLKTGKRYRSRLSG